ncbi:AAA family ATPase [Streptomyces sp. NPDC059718]
MTPAGNSSTDPGTLALRRHLETTRFIGLVVLIGASGSGKSHRAAKAFAPTQISSLDHYRALASDDAGNQDATADAVTIQTLILSTRLRRGLYTVVDNTSVEAGHREDLIALARDHGRPAIAVPIVTDLDTCLARNALRPPARRVPDDTVRWQHHLATESLPHLMSEGFTAVYPIHSPTPADPDQENA